MTRKVKEFLADILAGIMLVTLFCTFILCFIFVEVHFFKCVFFGMLGTISLASFYCSREIISE